MENLSFVCCIISNNFTQIFFSRTFVQAFIVRFIYFKQFYILIHKSFAFLL